ncbi:thioredoxin domain-containing protein [Sphingobium lignivorans]|uniref:Protein-disulfide isomerase n=1 Tax=Sphingobium lignivorans TaxID=2735886 RepID=A0ABR6NIS0_9SPHN|nr:thioredoxin domain-containing protein [Sphingobium lignivorans]MBB5987177.1 protein-disulfide isomerase [Sphingobium lignivorans]
MLRRFLSCLVLPFMLAAPAVAPAQQRAAATDWTSTVTIGSNGAFILGNPKAPNRLVEYLSYTCSHCAHFQAEGAPQLKAQWIRRGLLSLEFRNYVRDPFDLAAAMLARCGGAARFAGNHETLFAGFEDWMKRAQAYADAQKDAAPTEDRVEQITDIADKTGLIARLAPRGLAPAAQRQCLADKQALSQVLGLTASAWDSKEFSGTPFFILNGRPLADVHDWAGLRPLLPALPRSGN